MKPSFIVENLSVSFTGANRDDTFLHVEHLEIFPEVTAIVGESGSGKSLLGEALFAFFSEDELINGRVVFEGVNIIANPQYARTSFWGKTWAIVPQIPQSSFSPLLRIHQHLQDARLGAGLLPYRESEAKALLAALGLHEPEHILHAYVWQLSGGEVQRVSLALALAQETAWILADEPTKGLDEKARTSMLKLLQQIRTAGRSLLLITHDLPLAFQIADRVLVLCRGQIVEDLQEVTPWQIRHPYTQSLVRALPENGFKPLPPPSRILGMGCDFNPVCPRALPICQQQKPQMWPTDKGKARCFHYA